MVMFYKTMMVSGRTLQMNDYIKTNAKTFAGFEKKLSLGK
jgi:hypothetical protein